MKINEIFESAYSAGVSDGIRGQRDPRASAKYGPQASEYDKGYSAGLRKGEEEREKRGQQRDAELAPYRSMDEKELLNLEKELLSRRKEIADIAQKKRGVSLDFDSKKHGLPDDLKQESNEILQKLRLIDQVKFEKNIEETAIDEDLKKWFGDGKKGGAGGGGWDAYNSKGERIGKCGETDGRAKPKCLSKSKAASLRNSDANDDGKKDGKAGIARAVKRKRRKDPNPDREGKAKNVKNKT